MYRRKQQQKARCSNYTGWHTGTSSARVTPQTATLTLAAKIYAARTGAYLLFLKVMNVIKGHTVPNSTGSEPVRRLSA